MLASRVISVPNDRPCSASTVWTLRRLLRVIRAVARPRSATHASLVPKPAVLDSGVPDAACFEPLDLGAGPPDSFDPLKDVRAYVIVCP